MIGWLVRALAVLVTAGAFAIAAHGQDDTRQAVRLVIERFGQAIDNADLPMLLAQLAEDAVMDSKIAGGKVGKQKYADAMAAAFRTGGLVGMEVRDIKITIVDATRARVRATISPWLRAQRLVYDHEWTLEQRDGRWLIIESTYPVRVPEPVEPPRIA
jgi:ketosteroid isomerase-like protein